MNTMEAVSLSIFLMALAMLVVFNPGEILLPKEQAYSVGLFVGWTSAIYMWLLVKWGRKKVREGGGHKGGPEKGSPAATESTDDPGVGTNI